MSAPRSPAPIALVNVSGPYGAGKDTMLGAILDALGERGWRVKTITTRPATRDFDPSYTTIDRDQFQQRTSRGRWLVTEQLAGSVLYGTSLDEIHEVGERGMVGVHSVYADPQGAGRLRELLGAQLLSFGLLATGGDEASELAELNERLRRRGREDEQAIARRQPGQLQTIAYVRSNPLVQTSVGSARVFDHVLVNDDLQRASGELLARLRAAGVLGSLTGAREPA